MYFGKACLSIYQPASYCNFQAVQQIYKQKNTQLERVALSSGESRILYVGIKTEDLNVDQLILK